MKLKQLNTPENKKHAVAIFLSVFVGLPLFLVFAAFLINLLPTAKADKVTLQESVEMAQADYDVSQAQAMKVMEDTNISQTAALQEYCKDWQRLADAKIMLASKMKLNATTASLYAEVDCSAIKISIITVPASF